VISAIYLLRLFRRSMHGPMPVATDESARPDARPLELLVLAPLLALAVWIGLFPNALLGKLEGSTATYLPRAAIRTYDAGPAYDYYLAVVTPK
jgi:NADH-quinone oxidoreductase subunit M